jgi:hypothetical protein
MYGESLVSSKDNSVHLCITTFFPSKNHLMNFFYGHIHQFCPVIICKSFVTIHSHGFVLHCVWWEKWSCSCACLEGMWGSGSMTPVILNLAQYGEWSASCPGCCNSRERGPLPHWTWQFKKTGMYFTEFCCDLMHTGLDKVLRVMTWCENV